MSKKITMAVKSMILEVLEASEKGMILVDLHEAVSEQLNRRRIQVGGCEYVQVRYALRWLIAHKFVLAGPIGNQRQNHYTYVRGANLDQDQVKPFPRTTNTVTNPIPPKRMTPFEFALYTLIHVQSQVQSFWNPKTEKKKKEKSLGFPWIAKLEYK